MDSKSLESRLAGLESRRDFTQKQVNDLSAEVDALETEVDTLNQVASLFEKLSQDEIEQGVKAYLQLLEEGLKAIFPDQEVGLKGEIAKIRGKVSLKLKTTFKGKDGLVVEGESIDSFGGAVSSVKSLLLRVCLIMKRDLRPLLILDESFPAVDSDRVVLLVDFLKALCKKTDMDILCITHNTAICDNADLAYVLKPSKQGARLERI